MFPSFLDIFDVVQVYARRKHTNDVIISKYSTAFHFKKKDGVEANLS